MKVAILSDIHANYLALKAVINHASKQNIKQIWVLGDTVDYGVEPVETYELLFNSGYPIRHIFGDHEAYYHQNSFPENLSPNFKISTQWTRVIIHNDGSTGEYLQPGLPHNQDPRTVLHHDNLDIILTHDLIFEGEEEYSFSEYEYYPRSWDLEIHLRLAAQKVREYVEQSRKEDSDKTRWNFPFQKSSSFNPILAFYGHTHIPTFASMNGKSELSSEKVVIQKEYCFADNPVSLINPGSVGQSRDLNPGASFLVLDTKKKHVVFHRVRYDQEPLINKINQVPPSMPGDDFLTHFDAAQELIKTLTTAPLNKSAPKEWREHFEIHKNEVCDE